MKLFHRGLKSNLLIVLLLLISAPPLTASREDHDDTGTSRQGALNPFSTNPDNAVLGHLIDNSTLKNQGLEFKCVKSSGGWRPQSTRTKGHNKPFPPLGPQFISTKEICEKVVAASKNGIVCSKTGVDSNYTPTHFSGSTKMSPEFGLLSLPTDLESCLIATENSLPENICYFDGEGWFVEDIKGDKKNKRQNFQSVEACVKSYGATPPKKPSKELFTDLFKKR